MKLKIVVMIDEKAQEGLMEDWELNKEQFGDQLFSSWLEDEIKSCFLSVAKIKTTKLEIKDNADLLRSK